MNRWQAVVFDLDDTLYPERNFVLSGFRAVAAWAEMHLGIPAEVGFAELNGLFQQGARGDTFDRWLGANGLDGDRWVPRLVHVYREHSPQIAPFSEATAMLDMMRGRVLLGLVSDGYLAVQRRKLNALGIASSFDAIVFSDEWGREAWKPSQRPFRSVLERLQVDPPRAVYVGDNPLKDFKGAREVGMATVWMRRSVGEYANCEPPAPEYTPDHTVSSFAQLASWLGFGAARLNESALLNIHSTFA